MKKKMEDEREMKRDKDERKDVFVLKKCFKTLNPAR